MASLSEFLPSETKENSITGEAIEHAKFHITYTSNGEAADGFQLKEPLTQTVIIHGNESKAGQTVSLEFRNQPKGSVTLYKFSSVDRKTPLEGVGFKITFADGKAVDNIGGKQITSINEEI